MTHDALAAAAGISKPYLSQIETRQRVGTIDVLSKVASALSVPVDDLIEPPAQP
nr:helix-turn-helix transcriptional regulator [Burkholderia anthina]